MASHQPDIDNIYSYDKDPYEAKYQLLIGKHEGARLKHYNDAKIFVEYANDMDSIYKNVEEYNPHNERKILIVFDVMIADLLSNKKTSTNSNRIIY